MNKSTKNFFAAGVIALATPFAASAATVAACGVGSGLSCVADLGSIYMPDNSGGGDTEVRVELAVSDALGGLLSIDLTLLGKSDDGYGDAVTGTDGSWTTPDMVEYITVKAGNLGYVVIEAGNATTGLWSTMGLFNGGGNQPNVSHISYWGTDTTSNPPLVPLPAAGLMLLAGLGGLAGLRRKKS